MLIQPLGVFERVFPDGMTTGRSLLVSLVGFIIVFAVLGVIALFVKGMGAFFDAHNKKADTDTNEKADSAAAAPSAPVPSAPVTSAAYTGPQLDGVSETEAAVIMALVSHESDIPLNRLRFNSIKFKEEITK